MQNFLVGIDINFWHICSQYFLTLFVRLYRVCQLLLSHAGFGSKIVVLVFQWQVKDLFLMDGKKVIHQFGIQSMKFYYHHQMNLQPKTIQKNES